MYIRTTRAKNREYISLAESYWEDGQSKQRVLYNFGRADLIRSDEGFLKVVKRLCEIAKIPLSGAEEEEKNNFFENCSEATLYNFGYLAYLKLWRELGIEGCLEEAQHDTKITFSLPQTAFLMVVQHLLEPMSKYAAYENHARYFNMPEVQLHHLYRALDKLCEQKEDIETGLFQYNYIRVNKSVEIVFYDVTTIHFESTNTDELKEFGFSKNGKFNEVQVVLGMIIDERGMPVGYELYKGNTFEGKTMVETLNKIKKRFKISRVIIVADRGLNQKLNLKLIKDAGYNYIVGTKLKSGAAALQKKVLSDEGFEDIFDKKGNLLLRYKLVEHKNVYTDEKKVKHTLLENIAVSYSPKRAKKDIKDRDRLVKKAEKLLENPEEIKSTNKRGGRKYIDQTTQEKDVVTYSLAKDKIERDSKFDGYYAIQTSEKSLSASEIMDAYHMLWKIEESFRIMKSIGKSRRN
jgi:hypothetical protein